MIMIVKRLKQVFWKLPVPVSIKEKVRQWYADKKYVMQEKREDRTVKIRGDEQVLKKYIEHTLELPKRVSKDYQPEKVYEDEKSDITLIAYYLTQFHPTKENDSWWGKGITEWDNVCRAVPQFCGHNQPRIPGELGFYDLRLKENMERQIQLAKNYGINAFSFYYYWFDGKRILERPLNMFLDNQDLDMPFILCWANENWTKRYSGTNSDVLIGMNHDVTTYLRFIDDVWEMFLDKRYFRMDGKPVLQIYRPSFIPESKKVLEHWKKVVREKTGLELYLIGVQENIGEADLNSKGYDAECEWQCGHVRHICKELSHNLPVLRKDFDGKIHDYKEMVETKKYLIKYSGSRKVYRAVMPGWDNTPRRNQYATIFHGSTPELYKTWLKEVIRLTRKDQRLDADLIFINAWNEWGEGAYLEPDRMYGYAYLQATKEAKMEAELWRS